MKCAHSGTQNPDIEVLVAKNDKPFKMCYAEDPFGIVFEIYTHSYELTYSSGAYQK